MSITHRKHHLPPLWNYCAIHRLLVKNCEMSNKTLCWEEHILYFREDSATKLNKNFKPCWNHCDATICDPFNILYTELRNLKNKLILSMERTGPSVSTCVVWLKSCVFFMENWACLLVTPTWSTYYRHFEF